jgi:hypothetical protein
MACGRDGILGLGGLGGFGGFDGGCGRCGGCGDDKRIAVITAVRAIVAKGADFDRVGDWL